MIFSKEPIMKKTFFSIFMIAALSLASCDKDDPIEPDNDKDGSEQPEPEPNPGPGEVQEELGFTYAQGELFNYGKGKKETIDVAMGINDPGLAGKKITALKAYISTAEGISGISLWGSKNLTIENKMNVPDLFSYDVTPTPATVGMYNLQKIEVKLDEPYEITSDPVYFGYTLTVDENTTDEQKSPIVLAANQNPNGLYLHMNKSILKWTAYSSNAGGVAYIVAEIDGEFPEYSLDIQESNVIFGAVDTTFEALFYVSNKGADDINEITYTYSYDNSEELMENTIALDPPVSPNIALTTPVTLIFEPITTVGEHVLNVTITEVNGEANEGTNASFTKEFSIYPFVPTHRPLMEEYTGLWCGWCTRGYYAMEEIADIYGDKVVGIAYHNGDPMAVTNSYPVAISGFPGATVDRLSVIDPYYGSYDSDFGISLNLEERIATLAPADIEVEATLNGTMVNIQTTVTFIEDYTDANYKIGYVLVCNGLEDPSWSQANYFADPKYKPEYEGTPLEVLTTWPTSVKGLVFNDVAVNVAGMRGVAESLPTNITAGEAYTHSYSYDIDGNVLVQNPDNLMVAAFLIDGKNNIVNANKYYLGN